MNKQNDWAIVVVGGGGTKGKMVKKIGNEENIK